MAFTPYESDNIIFIDTEFRDLDPYRGELLSIDMVKMTGEEIYIELDYYGACSEWVQKHILSTIKAYKV